MAVTPTDLTAALVMTPVATADWLVVLPPAWCILAGAVLLMARKSLHLQGLLAVPALAVLVLLDALLFAHVSANGPVTMVMGRWLPPFGIAFTADLTGVLFALAGAVADRDDAVDELLAL